MKFSDYFSDMKPVLLVCLAGGLFFSVLLSFWGIDTAGMILLWIIYCCILSCSFLCGCLRRRRRAAYLLSELEALDQKYLIAEITDRPETYTEQLYFHLMKTSLKAMTDEAARSAGLNREYREFVEQWVHEIKAPITGIRLICENEKNSATRRILSQAEIIEQDVERVLFYARIGSAEKDYFIKETPLKGCVLEALAQNRQLLIQNGVSVRTEGVTHTVRSDSKWIVFLLNQFIVNSTKYKSSQPPVIEISSQDLDHHVSLSVTDNGIGIRQSEISRVFDKGFVGSNGREGKNATGMGLYMCKQLCRRLGIDIEISSEPEQYTTVTLYFPRNSLPAE